MGEISPGRTALALTLACRLLGAEGSIRGFEQPGCLGKGNQAGGEQESWSSKWKKAVGGIIRSSCLARSHLEAAAVPAWWGEGICSTPDVHSVSTLCWLPDTGRNKEGSHREGDVEKEGSSCQVTPGARCCAQNSMYHCCSSVISEQFLPRSKGLNKCPGEKIFQRL